MKSKLRELDVDFIGGQNNPLKRQEQISISMFIKKLKDSRNKRMKRKTAKTVKHSV